MVKKYVITGGSCSGKTTLVNELKKRGYNTLDEIARQVLEERNHIGFDYHEKLARQSIMYLRQISEERKIDEMVFGIGHRKNNSVFLDRGIIDVIAYSAHLFGKVPDEFCCFDLRNRYDGVFVLDKLDFLDDGIRIESDNSEAEKIHNRIIQEYKKAGYDLIFVPVMGVEERADYVLEKIK
jgi:predicted ATPase